MLSDRYDCPQEIARLFPVLATDTSVAAVSRTSPFPLASLALCRFSVRAAAAAAAPTASAAPAAAVTLIACRLIPQRQHARLLRPRGPLLTRWMTSTCGCTISELTRLAVDDSAIENHRIHELAWLRCLLWLTIE